MPSTIAETGPCKFTLTITVPKDEVRQSVDKNYLELQRTVALPGFRAGKSPITLLKKKYGHQVAVSVRDELMHESFKSAIDEHKLEPVGEPAIQNVSFDPETETDLSYEAVCFVKPTFELKTYTGIDVEIPDHQVTDAEVTDVIERMHRQSSPVKELAAEDVIGQDDMVVATLHIHLDGAELVHLDNVGPITQEAESVYGIPVENLFDKIAGNKPGSEIKFKAEVPDTFMPKPEARGKTVEIHLDIKEAGRVELMDKAAWLKAMDFDTEDEFRAEIRKRLERELGDRLNTLAEDKILTTIVNDNQFTLPDELIQQQFEMILLRERMKLEQQKMEESEIEKNLERLRSGGSDDLTRLYKSQFILDHIAKKEKVYVTEEEVIRAVAEIAARHNVDPQRARQELEQGGQLQQLRNQLKEKKIREILRSKAKISKVPADAVEKAAKPAKAKESAGKSKTKNK